MTVQYDVQDSIAILTIDRPPVNAIDVNVRKGLCDGVHKASADSAVRAIFIHAAGRTFLSGADLSEFDTPIDDPGYYETLALIEACEKPVIVALHGTALGGGLETALACHYRCAVPDARMGFPEITLGIVPGAGGTQRLPRLVGAAKTLDFMLSGAPFGAEEALALGVIDKIVPSSREGGLAYAKELLAQGAKPRRTGDRTIDAAGFDEAGVAALFKKHERGLKGRKTQHAILDAIRASVDRSFADGLKREDELSRASLLTRESQALRHIFFAERDVAKIPGLPPTKALPIERAAVVGAGTMGGGIAMSFANSGVPVTLIEVSQEALDRGMKTIRANYDETVKRGRLTESERDARLALIGGALDASGAKDADVAVEAVFENMALKKSILASLDKAMKPSAIIASNTSTLSLKELASATKRPSKVVGLHFFSPAHIMRLLEIVRYDETTAETLVTALDVARKLRKTGVVSGDAFGFIGNKMMQDGYFREAEQMLLEGAPPEQIDRVMEAFGFAMGPNRVNDMAGVDVGTLVRQELATRETRPDPYFVVSDALTPLGRLGQKTGKGVYRYEPGDRTAHPDPEVTALIERLAAERQIKRGPITDAEIEERCILPLINTGADLLANGIAYRAADIDVVWTSGYGFPRHLGGPMFYGDTLGLKNVLARVEAYHAKHGHYWAPSPLLIELAKAGKTFTDYDKGRG